MQKENQFTVLEDRAIGRNIAMYRKVKGIKAIEVAEHLGMKEAAYTRYERGEVSISAKMVQQIAELLNTDPLNLLAVPAGSLIENGNHATNTVVMLNSSNKQTVNDEQMKMTLKLIESVTLLNEKLMAMLTHKTKVE